MGKKLFRHIKLPKDEFEELYELLLTLKPDLRESELNFYLVRLLKRFIADLEYQKQDMKKYIKTLEERNKQLLIKNQKLREALQKCLELPRPPRNNNSNFAELEALLDFGFQIEDT